MAKFVLTNIVGPQINARGPNHALVIFGLVRPQAWNKCIVHQRSWCEICIYSILFLFVVKISIHIFKINISKIIFTEISRNRNSIHNNFLVKITIGTMSRENCTQNQKLSMFWMLSPNYQSTLVWKIMSILKQMALRNSKMALKFR